MTDALFDDAIHAERDGKAVCGSDGPSLLPWFLYPCSDIGGSYCWTCLTLMSLERFPGRPHPVSWGPLSDDFMRQVSEALRAVER